MQGAYERCGFMGERVIGFAYKMVRLHLQALAEGCALLSSPEAGLSMWKQSGRQYHASAHHWLSSSTANMNILLHGVAALLPAGAFPQH